MQTFPWARLPTELKTRIIAECLHNQQPPSIRHAFNAKKYIKTKGPVEITDQLGYWSGLLRVSFEVRAIALQLCLVGGEELVYYAGLCIDAKSYPDFRDVINRLGRFYQMTEQNGVPINAKTLASANKFNFHPRKYPQLSQYATMLQGVQGLRLSMKYMDFFRFFKITKGGFQRHWGHEKMDYTVFDRMPKLRAFILVLPDWTKMIKTERGYGGPPIHNEEHDSCPRTLARLISDRAIEVLAPYDFKWTVTRFIDGHEQERFETLRAKSMAEQGMGKKLPSRESTSFWPPKCQCDVPCATLVDRYFEFRNSRQ